MDGCREYVKSGRVTDEVDWIAAVATPGADPGFSERESEYRGDL